MNKRYRPASEVRIIRHIANRKTTSLSARVKIKKTRIPKHPTFTEIVLDHITDFIWLTPTEVLSIAEQVNERFEEHHVRTILWHLVRQGKLEKRTSWTYGRANGYQVKKPVIWCDGKLRRSVWH